MEEQIQQIDEHAISRQLAVYGHAAQSKLMALRVFIHGVTGLGVQVAKNLILAGPKQVSIYDPNIVTEVDIGRNFYCRQEHIGNVSRAEASLSELKNLNPSVKVGVAADASIEYISQNFDCVVVLDHYNREYLLELNKVARNKGIGFILGGSLGLYGYTFVDFGQNHYVLDATGEESKLIHIAGITMDEQGLVCLHEGKRHGLNDGDSVVFRQVKGMTEINGQQFKVTVKTPYSFTIGDTRSFSAYVGGGIASEVKVPWPLKSYGLEKSLRYPYPPESKSMPIASWDKFGVPEQLHVILNGLYSFQQQYNRLPRPLNFQDAAELERITKECLTNKMEIEGEDFKVEKVDEALIRNVAFYADSQISACNSFWGGIITQQVVKMTGKYTPLRQWLHHEFFEVLPEGPITRNIPNNRYYDYHLLFGDEFVQKMSKSRCFVVGAGALGCEFIKMFSLMGLGHQGGKVAVTDDDNIEISNLNRQFLFRKHHVGSSKSETACEVGRAMNPSVPFAASRLRVSPENQTVFDDSFWMGLDFVVNAVDNVNARKFVDAQCVWYEKPLFESGTLGTKCHSQVILPHVTLTYTDIIDPPEEGIPLCTLKNFPYEIEHTIQWARDYFEGTFTEASSEFLSFYENGESYLQELRKQFRQNPSILKSKLESIKKLRTAAEKQSYHVCVQLAVGIFQQVFNHQIRLLINAFPEDHVNTETKKLFWSGLKRFPTPLELDLKDPVHLDLIQGAANIYATLFGLPLEINKQVVADIASYVKPPPFIPRVVKFATEEGKNSSDEPIVNENDENDAELLLEELSTVPLRSGIKPTAISFEKDDATNYHIEFMGGVANLRARNYRIEEVDNFRIKLIAGKIIPAIATTTAMVVGAVGIEIIKYILGKPASAFKDVAINLALPVWVFNDPLPAIINTDKQFDKTMNGPIKVVPGKYTKWDKINFKGPLTLQQLVTHLETSYKFKVSMVTYGTATIYPPFDKNAKKRLDMNIPEAIESVIRKPLNREMKFLQLGVTGNDEKGIDCMLPDIKYQI